MIREGVERLCGVGLYLSTWVPSGTYCSTAAIRCRDRMDVILSPIREPWVGGRGQGEG